MSVLPKELLLAPAYRMRGYDPQLADSRVIVKRGSEAELNDLAVGVRQGEGWACKERRCEHCGHWYYLASSRRWIKAEGPARTARHQAKRLCRDGVDFRLALSRGLYLLPNWLKSRDWLRPVIDAEMVGGRWFSGFLKTRLVLDALYTNSRSVEALRTGRVEDAIARMALVVSETPTQYESQCSYWLNHILWSGPPEMSTIEARFGLVAPKRMSAFWSDAKNPVFPEVLLSTEKNEAESEYASELYAQVAEAGQ